MSKSKEIIMEKYISVPFDKVHIDGGFWKIRQDVNRDVTVNAVYERFRETHRFDALSCKKCDDFEPHIFWDSDVAKWLEGAAYLLSEKRDRRLEALCDEMIEKIVTNQSEDGYFNSYYLTVAPEERFTKRENHELYCAGHLIEAAIAYRDATGKDALLRAMMKYVDLIHDVFVVKQSAAFVTPGHP
ncbi:MAG: glycoside hydrolase family 127 protein, partial [Clostridia bacterium]|nr:glycoside hydrolase family 127 protein [Clostridia bacterium]